MELSGQMHKHIQILVPTREENIEVQPVNQERYVFVSINISRRAAVIPDESFKTSIVEVKTRVGQYGSGWFIIFPSWLKTNDGSKVEESMGQHPAREIESIGGWFPKAHNDK